MAEGITSKTKGSVRSISPKGIPVSFAVPPPNVKLSGSWYLERVRNKAGNTVLGTSVDINFNADPLLGLEITIDLLGTIAFGIGSIGGVGPGVLELYKQIQGLLKKGVDFGNDEVKFAANVDIYMDLIITNTIKTGIGFQFNTAGKREDALTKIEATNTLKVEFKVGVKIKGEFAVVTVKADAYFEASGSGEASITFGHTINYDDKGLYYRPQLGFDGLNAKYIIYVSVGLAMKIAKDKNKVETERKGNQWEIARGNYDDVIPKFDVIEELETLLNIDANIPLIKNK
ncbi:hypothetical protein ETU10_02450 [Apibacter muscae]|uniref:hypothetical protein n=1 Tax=Apibacter muscae TaxID=2509004 RepID=UPI0011AE0E67|nr:hypothetical protein [Apibacter muscae]TWP24842.1 hypothetical protein ETU10_02450 [Apibacter muscae]